MSLAKIVGRLYVMGAALEAVTTKSVAASKALQKTRVVAEEVNEASRRFTEEQLKYLQRLSESVIALGGVGVDDTGKSTGMLFGVGGLGEPYAKKLIQLLEARDKYLTDSSISGIHRLDAVNQALKRLEEFIQKTFDPYFRIDKFYEKPKSQKKKGNASGDGGSASGGIGLGLNLPNNFDSGKATGELP